jgi:hypothetical protein
LGLSTSPESASGTTRREVQRPTDLSPITRPDRRNVFFALVASKTSGEPEEGVRIVVTNLANRTIKKSGMTNAYGWCGIRLADGNWSVQVTMPDGRLEVPEPLGHIKVRNGMISDLEGNKLPSLEIMR